MNNNDSLNKIGGLNNSPLILFQPFNIIVFLSFFSPIILALAILSLSFIFQNFKGFIYLGFLIGICVIRNFVYMMYGSQKAINDKSICNTIQFSQYGNATFSAYVFAFTITYLSIPMFSNSSVNYWIFSGLIVYFTLDMFIKLYKNCITSFGDLFLNILLGSANAALIVTLMYAGGSGQYLFFNEVSSNKDVCTMPKKQTFKCAVYKNGTLISGTP